MATQSTANGIAGGNKLAWCERSVAIAPPKKQHINRKPNLNVLG
ncbi:MAG: hypothetical protein Q8941_24510 [Bacteroidota bacterium]|nr:hypothetical protein [Bacteroidota bacterium]